MKISKGSITYIIVEKCIIELRVGINMSYMVHIVLPKDV